MNTLTADYLSHYGIRGMKWGVRRFETENGKLTSAGKARYKQTAKGLDDASKAFKEASKIGTSGQKSKVIKKSYKELSDKELKDRVHRLNLERQYGELTGDTKRVSSGADFVRESLQTIGALTAIFASAASAYIAFNS